MSARKPETVEHLKAATRNLDIATGLVNAGGSLVSPPAYDWALIVAFYSAVRFVNAYHWQCFDCDPKDHIARNGFVSKMMQPISLAYDNLYSRSRVIRYEVVQGFVSGTAATSAITIAERVRDEVLRRI